MGANEKRGLRFRTMKKSRGSYYGNGFTQYSSS